jgi:hypothetical protein
MIADDQELEATLERIAYFYARVRQIRRTENSVASYHASASGFLFEIERMQAEVSEYLKSCPAELETTR